MQSGLEINLPEFIKLLARKAWIVLLAAVICCSAVLLYTMNFVSPQYEASVTMYVNNKSNQEGNAITSNDLTVATKLVNTYINIIKSDRVLEKVVAETGTSISPASMRNMISAASLNDTEMFRVSVTSQEPELSAKLANAIADIAPAEISQIIQGSSAEIVDHAKVPTTRSSPNYSMNGVLGFAVGALLAVVVIILAHALDVRVKSEEDLAEICSVPVLGTIPDVLEIVKKTRKQRN